MKYPFLILMIFSLSFVGCIPSEYAKFTAKAEEFASNDNKIDPEEYKQLNDIITSSNDEGFNKFKEGEGENVKVKNEEVVDYLVKYYEAKGIKIERENIWNPNQVKIEPQKFNFDVYIENSASMDGYVKGVTNFETAIYNFLGDIKISDISKDLNLYYINTDITFTKKNALPKDIEDFIKKLEPTTFQQRGGNRGSSDIKEIISKVLENVNEENLSVLISDFVFSPGDKRDALDYLNNQTTGIKIDVAQKLKDYDLSIVMIQLVSDFDGNYYDKNDKPVGGIKKRPYYIWLIGNTNQIKAVNESKILENIKGGYQNRVIFSPIKNEGTSANYKILFSPKIGDFELNEGAKGKISSASINRQDKKFGFNVVADFSSGLQYPNYYSDSSNYVLSNNTYKLSVEPIDKNDQTTKGFTHLLKLETQDLRAEKLVINVVGKMPAWVENYTSIDDTKIKDEECDEKEKICEWEKTFGLKYLIGGINDAFYPQSGKNILYTINIPIEK